MWAQALSTIMRFLRDSIDRQPDAPELEDDRYSTY